MLGFIILVLSLILAAIYGMRAEYAASKCRDVEAFCSTFMCLAFIILGGFVSFAIFLTL